MRLLSAEQLVYSWDIPAAEHARLSQQKDYGTDVYKNEDGKMDCENAIESQEREKVPFNFLTLVVIFR